MLIIKGLGDKAMEVSVHFWVSQRSIVSFKNKSSREAKFPRKSLPLKPGLRLAQGHRQWRRCYVGLDLPVWLPSVLHGTTVGSVAPLVSPDYYFLLFFSPKSSPKGKEVLKNNS